MNFNSLGLSDLILQSITDKGYTEPSPIQAQAIPAVLSGKDVLAAAQTGTGKTAGFTLPILQQISSKPRPKGKRKIKALILTPTRELAAQVGESVRTYGSNLDINSCIIFGGVSARPQISQIRAGVDILIATPGRLLDLQNQGIIDLGSLDTFVLDEADRMLDMGFIHDIRKINRVIPRQRQTLMFSATFSTEILELTKEFLDQPIYVQVAPRNTTAENVNQLMYRTPKSRKTALLKHLISTGNWDQVLVFTRTKHGANRLSDKLNRAKITSMPIHGNKSQNARVKALEGFKSKEIKVLVATDIAARGLDIKQLPHVVNFELPNVPEDYVHRIGRTARAGADGYAVSLVDQEEVKFLRSIERLLDQKIPEGKLSNFDFTVTKQDEEEPRRVNFNRGRKPFKKSPNKKNKTTRNKPTKR